MGHVIFLKSFDELQILYVFDERQILFVFDELQILFVFDELQTVSVFFTFPFPNFISLVISFQRNVL